MKHERWTKAQEWVERIVDGIFVGHVAPRSRRQPVRLEEAFATPALAQEHASEFDKSMQAAKWRRTKPDPACAATNFDEALFQAQLKDLEQVLPSGVRTEGSAKTLAKLSSLGETQPSVLRFYLWCSEPNKLFAEMVLREWYSLDEVIEETVHLQKAFQLDSTLTPVGRDPHGFHVCVQRYSGKVLLWDHESREMKRLVNSFSDLLAKLKTPLARAAAKRLKAAGVASVKELKSTAKKPATRSNTKDR